MNEGMRLIIRRYKLAKLEAKLLKTKQGTKDLPSVTNALRKAREEEDV